MARASPVQLEEVVPEKAQLVPADATGAVPTNKRLFEPLTTVQPLVGKSAPFSNPPSAEGEIRVVPLASGMVRAVSKRLNRSSDLVFIFMWVTKGSAPG